MAAAVSTVIVTPTSFLTLDEIALDEVVARIFYKSSVIIGKSKIPENKKWVQENSVDEDGRSGR